MRYKRPRTDNFPCPLFKKEGHLKNQRGSALIITVLIVAILVTFVTEFAYEVYIDTTSLSNWSNAQRASLIAKSGQSICADYLTRALGSSYTYMDKVVFPVEKDLGTGTRLLISIEDENAKFNINSIIYAQTGKENVTALSSLKKLFEYLNINTNLALIIADWIDPDSEPRLPDSEENAKNAFLSSIDELKLIPGIDKKTFETISPFLTVHGNNQMHQININTAKLPVLIGLDENMNETLAKQLIDYRETTPFDKYDKIRGQISNVIGINIGYPYITNKSSIFRITATATVNETTRVIESVVDQSMKIYFWREG